MKKRILCAALAMLLCLSACALGEGWQAGTYSASAQGFGGAVNVTMTFNEKGLTDVAIDAGQETAAIGGAAAEALAAKMKETGSANVDAVAGATVTSNAIAEAAAACEKQAKGETVADQLAFVAGTYTSTQSGHGGAMEVQVTFSEDAITAIEVLSSKETPGIGDKALYSELPQAIMAAQSVGVDSIAGATMSSNAVKNAVLDCAKLAGANTSLLLIAPQKEALPEQVELTADVVIVGGGGAGLAAAVTAIEEGASVIIIEKSGYVGGNSLVNGGIYNAPNPELQQQVMMDDASRSLINAALAEAPVNEAHAKLIADVKADYEVYLKSGSDRLFDSANWFALQTYNGGDKVGDVDVIRAMADNSADGLNWLHKIGWLDTGNVIVGAGALYQRTVSSVVPLGKGMIDAYLNQMEGENCQILYSTTAQEIMMENGRAIGVVSTNRNGQTVTVHADKGVIISTGGFGGNAEMVEQYNTTGKWPSLENIGSTNLGSITGDGIRMAEAAGAALRDMEQLQLLYLCDPLFNGETARNHIKGISASGQLFFNKEGERFVREDGRRDDLSLATLNQTDSVYWLVTCGDVVTEPDKATDYSGTLLTTLIEEGRVIVADTFPELCEKIGIPTDVAVAELEAYQADVNAGVAEDRFGRTGFMKMENGPWYAALTTASIHHTMGGIAIDAGAHVLDTQGNVIPGLYAAGEVAGGVHGGNRLGGNAIVDTVVFGRLAGKNAAQMQ